MDKTRIILEIECGKVTCGECEWQLDGECKMFDRYLVDDVVRCPECLEAEKRMDETMLKTAMAKAAAPQGL